MKNGIQLIFLVLRLSGYAQGNGNVADTLFYPNGEIEILFEYNSVSHAYNGRYLEYDSSGVLLIDGHYQSVDSTKCTDCYDVDLGGYGFDTKLVHVETATPGSIKIGVWKYYHPNGKIKMYGSYSASVHTRRGYTEPLNKMNSGPVNVWIVYDDLREGEWLFFDELGNMEKTEFYVDGSLLFTINSN